MGIFSRCLCRLCLETEVKILGNISGFGKPETIDVHPTATRKMVKRMHAKQIISGESSNKLSSYIQRLNPIWHAKNRNPVNLKTKNPLQWVDPHPTLKHQLLSILLNTGCPPTQVKRNETPVNLQSAFHEKTLSMAWHPDPNRSKSFFFVKFVLGDDNECVVPSSRRLRAYIIIYTIYVYDGYNIYIYAELRVCVCIYIIIMYHNMQLYILHML